jgi:cytochrome oxidase Cu insertion factor (SCO1/SenC/PrrC family)
MKLLPRSMQLGMLYAIAAFMAFNHVPRALGAERPHVELLEGFVDDLGRPVSDHLPGRPYRLVVFGYTSCPDVCPLTLVAVHRALVTLADEAAAVDPDRDSVQKIHDYVSAFVVHPELSVKSISSWSPALG